jgi:hypothetical protein
VPLELLEEHFDKEVIEAVKILTKPEEISYEEYIDNIFETNNVLALWVKKADMKDHIAQTDTLTDKLKMKYLPVLARFI